MLVARRCFRIGLLGQLADLFALCSRRNHLDPDYALAWNTKGCALEALGRDNEARQCYENARQLGYKG